ncbi:uncharacterized protein Dwil_GK10885 [Drosophila willistoni]|uniref:Peptidase S1 domain-containing protein n=1 Tax=Drosophila willistoni TaxID=7260 RepID=B4N9K8_DROWI|nr:chymotrypsin-2 [Drosophila willistoni]EDW81684.1 uncharacterized protein Dwil_GK10885 [Drosophila willistoni]
MLLRCGKIGISTIILILVSFASYSHSARSDNLQFIVGGQNADEGDAPYQISLQTLLGRHLCGGAIISDRWLLTAGHCVSGYPADRLQVVTGTLQYAIPGAIYYPESIYLHCNYDTPKYHNDIALLRVNQSIVFDAHTQPVNLPIGPWAASGAQLLFTGWGTQSISGSTPARLQRVQQQYITSQTCKSLLSDYEDVELGPCHVCAYRQLNIGACHGDSGGPLVHEGILVGILNFFVPCAQGVPDVFMNIMFYRDWIRRVISGNAKCTQVHEQIIG